ncbi:MAG: hypothetical protein LBJ02_07995 [Bifidobacteriaceae bacterium]|jgi:hypothetical protein|nr:hypothetical protein [Bifidobacteriaceae bacterium]
MPGADVVEPLPPEPFSVWWLVAALVAVALAVALVAWPWVAKLWRHKKKTPRSQDTSVAATPAELSLRQTLERIDRVEAQWKSGELTGRAAAHEIAGTVRGFTGSDATMLTLLELRMRGNLPSLTALIEEAYPVEFGVSGEGDIERLAERARQAVRR